MFNVNQNLLDGYDAATTDQERARWSLTFSRNFIKPRDDEHEMDVIDDALMLCEAKSGNEGVQHFQADVMDYMEKRGENVSLQVLKADCFRLRKMLGIKND